MPDITDQMQLTTSTPQEAAQHIDGGNLFGIGADAFKQTKEYLQPEIDKLKLPSEATPQVSRYVAQSPEHAALAAPDVEKLSTMEKMVNFGADQMFGRRTLNDQISEINLRKMFAPDKVTENDELKLFQLNEDSKKFTDYGLTTAEQIPGLVAGGFASMGSSVWKHAELIAAGVAAGAGIGAVSGLAVGGVGAGPGAIAGATAGVVNSSLAAMTIDAVNSQMGLVYGELSNFKSANGKEIDHETKKNTAIGVGLVTGAVTAAVGKTVASTVPFLNKLINPQLAAKIVTDPTAAALTKTLFDIGKSVSAGGVGASLQKSTEIFATEFAKNYDGTEGSLLNSLSAAAKALNVASGDIAEAAVVGGITTGAISGVTGVAGFKSTKAGFKSRIQMAEENAVRGARDVTPTAPEQISDINRPVQGGSDGGPMPINPTPTDRASRALHLDSTLDAVAKVAKTTEMQKLSPNELNKVQADMLNQAGIKSVHLDKEELTKWTDSEQKARDVRNIIDPSGEAAAALNAPMKVEATKFMGLVEKYPEISELAKLNPEDPSGAQGKKFMEDLIDAQKKREELKVKLNAPDITPEEKATLEQTLQAQEPSHDVFGEQEYLNQPTFTEAIKSVVPDTEIAKFNKAQLEARTRVVTNISETAKYEMDQVLDVMTEAATDAQIETETQRIANDPNLKVVDRFTKTHEIYPTDRYKNTSEMSLNHEKPGFSPLAIDPRTLPEKLAKKYLDNEQLKKHKVFVKGGISLEDSAKLVGVNSGKNLLSLLASTPSREDIVQREVTKRTKEIADLVNASVNLNETALIKAYGDNTANHLAEMKFLKDKEWPTTRGGIRRIALPLPKIQELSLKAKTMVSKMTVGSLNANQFKVGERKSQRIAVDAILKNEVEKAFINKENAALNSELTKETLLATAKVNRVIKFAKRFNDPTVIQELKDAGKLYHDAVNEILDVYNLNPSKKDLAEKGSFQKYVKAELESGGIVSVIPDRLGDVRESVREMTVDQVLAVGDILKNTLHNARNKNKLYDKHENIKSAKTVAAYEAVLTEQAKSVFDYDPKKNDVVQKRMEKGSSFYRVANLVERPQHLLVKMDGGKVNGPWNDLVYRPMAQIGNDKKALALELEKHYKKIIEKFGKKEFENLSSDLVEVPEFENIPALGYGKVTKLELFMIELNWGNEGGIEAFERYGVTRAAGREILDKYLDHKHIEMAQEFRDVHTILRPKIAALALETEGVEPEWVEAQPYEAKGRQIPGGHFPLLYLNDEGRTQAKKLIGASEVNKVEGIKQQLFAQAETRQGHLESRTGSDQVLDLDINRYFYYMDQVIHDLAARKPIRDTAKLLADEGIRKSMIAVIGIEGYENVSDMVIDSAETTNKRGYNKTDNALLKMANHLGGGVTTVSIAAKLSSIAIQPASLTFAIDKMGVLSGSKYMAKAISNFASHPTLWKEMFDFSAEIHPPIRDTREDMEGDTVHSFLKLVPKEKSVLDPLTKGRDLVKAGAFHVLGNMDLINKVMVVQAAYMQAMNGDAPGVEAGNHAEAAKYASNLAELTQTHSNIRNLSPIQKEKYAKPILFFWNDANNVLNSTIARARDAKERFKKSGDKAAEGEWKEAAKLAALGIGGIMRYLFLIAGVSGLYENFVRGKQSFDEDNDGTLSKVKDLAGIGINNLVGTIPVVRDIEFAAGKTWQRQKTVEMPLNKVWNDFATSVSGVKHFLDFSESGNVTKQEARAWLYSAGYIWHLPVDAAYKALGKPDLTEAPIVIEGTIKQASDAITKYIKKNEDNPEIPKEFIEKLKTLQLETDSTKEVSKNDIPVNSQETIKQIVSQGKWNAFDEKTGAAGLYKYTESHWNNIKNAAPELALTDEGRVAKDQAQQEKAAKWELGENTRVLRQSNVPVTVENLYASQVLGSFKAVQVLQSPGDTKIKSLVGQEVLEANNLKGNMKVKDFKNWLLQKTAEAEMQLEEAKASVDKNSK